MKKSHPQLNMSEQMMHTLRHRLRVPVTVLMIASNLAFSLQSNGEVLVKTNSGSNTYLSPTIVLPGAHYADNSEPTASDILLFKNDITAASTFRISNVANSTLAVQGLRVWNPGGIITLQNNASQNQTLRIGSAGIDLSRATQNLVINNNTGGTMTLALDNAGAATWSVAQGRTLQVVSNITGTGTGLTINPGINGLGGTVNLGGANTFTGATTVNNSALILDYTSAANRIHSGSSLNLNRGTVTVQGGSTFTQVVNGLNLGSGLNQILRSGTTASINVGAISRASPNALLNINTTGFFTTSQANENGMLGGWAVFNNTDWLVGNGAATATALTAYTDRTGTWTAPAATNNVRITGTVTAVTSGTINSLKFNSGAFNVTQNAGTTLNIASGGILKNDNNATSISGGSLTAGGTANGIADSLYIWQSQNTMTITSNIVNNGTDVVNVVKAGASDLILNGTASTYTGTTTVANGRLTISNTGAINKAGNIEIYGNSGADNTGSLRWNTTTTDTITGNITGAAGTDAIRHTLQKLNSGVLILNPTVANTYFGSTLIDAGVLRAGKANAFSANSRFQFANVATAVLDLAGFNNTIRGLAGGGATGGNVTLGAGTLTLQNLENDLLSYSGIISGTGGLIKEGAGTQTFTANQTFTGPLSVNEGVLITSALATTNVTVNAGGTLQAGNLTSATSLNVNGNGLLQMKAGGNLSASPTVSLNGDGSTLQLAAGVTQNFGILTSAAGSRILIGAGTSDSNLTFSDNVVGTTNVIRGVIAMSGTTGAGKGNIIKTGNTNWELAGGNAYTGSTTINGGTLSIAASALVEVLPDLTALTLANASGVGLDLNGKSETIGSLSGGGASGGNVSLDAGRLTVGGNGATTTYAGIISGSGSLVKTGNGIMTLNGANTFTGGLEIQRGTLVLARAGGNTLATNVPVNLNGLNARLEVNTSQIMGALNAGPGTTVSVASGATLTTTQTAVGSVVHSGTLDAETRVIELTGLNAAANLRPGMSVNIPGVTGVYITQVLAGDQILVNKNVGADFSNIPLTFGTVGEMAGTLEGEGNWTKTGAGRTVLSGNNTLSGTMTLAEGSLQVGGVTSGGRNWTQNIIDDEASLVFSDTLSTTLDFTNNVAPALLFERIGSIGGGVSNVNTNLPHTTINLSGEATHMLLAVGANDATTTFKGSILGGATSVLVKEGNGTLTWQSDRAGAMQGTVRVESGGLAITGAQGLNTATRLAISNKPGAFLELATEASQSVFSLVGGGRGAVTTYANGVLGALGGAYLGGTGGEVRLVDLVSGDSSLPTLTLNSTAVNTVLRYGGAITGNGNLSKDGPNILELLGDNTYSGSTTIQAATASSTNSIVRLGAYGTSSGVGTLASSGFGSLPSTTRLQLNAGNDGTARNVAFDLNGATQTISSLASSFEVGTRTVFLRGGNLTINAQGTDTSGTFNGSFDGPGIINVLATLDPNGETDGWRLSGDSNVSQTGSFNIQGGKVTLDRPGGTMGDRVDVKVNNTGVLVAQQSDVIGSLSGNGNVSINSGHTLTISAAPKGGVADHGWSGTITGLGGLTLATGGSIRLTSAQSYLGGTTLNTGSALYLDYGSTAPQIIPGTLNLNGGSIYLTGNAGQTIANTIIGSGLTTISTQTGDDPKARLQLNSITRDTTVLAGGVNPGSGGGVLQIRGASVSTSVTNLNNILGGYATYHAVNAAGNPVVSWAKSNGAGVPVNGLADGDFVTELDAASNQNLDIREAGSLVLSNNAGTIRFNNPADVRLSLETATRIQAGGILVTPNVGPNDIVIDGLDVGSSITGGDSSNRVRRELIIHQYNTRGTLTLDTPIVDNGQATRLTKVGQGKLILTQINGYNGQTSILAGVLELADSPQDSFMPSKGRLGNFTGTYPIQNFGYLSFNRTGSNDVYDVNNDIIGSGVIRKLNSGTVALRGSNSSYTGPTQVLGGLLSVGTDRGLGSTDGLTSVGPLGILALQGVNSLENVVLNGGTLTASSGVSTLSGSLTLTTDSTLVAPSTTEDLILAGPVTAYPNATLTTAGNGSSGGKIILTNANNQIGNITLGARTSLQIGNNTNGSVGRGVITTGLNTNVITNTSNSQLVFGAKITGSGNFIQARNTVFLTQDNDYTGTTTIGGNGSVGIQNLVANLRVGADTYTGSVGTGNITIQAGNGGDSWLRYHLLKNVSLANNITINPILEGASTLRFAGLNRYSLGSMQLSGQITAGSHGISDQRAILQTEGGGGKMILSGTIENGENNSLNINNNGNFVFANENEAFNQDLWGVVAGGGVYTFRSAGSITLKGINTFNTSNYIKKGTLIVDNSAGLGLNDDNDFYLSRSAQIHFNYDETTGLISTMRGSLIRLNNNATLTLDDAVTVGNFGDITGDGTLNISANGGTAWVGLFGTNDLNTPANIGSTNQVTTVRVNSLPMTGMVSSLGTNYNINLGVLNGTGDTRLEYIGLGETTDRGINLTGGAGTTRIAGSGKGALILDGPITITNPGNKTLILHGQTIGNTVNGQLDEAGSVMSLVINPAAHSGSSFGNNDMYGLGRWILTNESNNFSGNVTVDLGVLELAGNLGNGTGTSSVFGDLTATREISLGTGNFDGRKFDVFSGGDNLFATSGLGATGTIVFNDPNAGTATFSSLITFNQPYNSTTNPGNGELVNNGNKVLVFNGTFKAGDNGSRNWILDGTNTGSNTINGVISENLSTGSSIGILKEGPGTWRLAGANTYEGTTTVARGTLELSGGLAIFDNGLINLSNAGSDASSVGGSILRVLQSETIGSLQGTIGTMVDIAGGQTLTLRAATNTFNGIVTGGGGIVRTNNDTNAREITFTNLNTYTGPTRVTTNGTNAVANIINVLYLANGGAASGIGAASSAASNLVLDSGTGGGGIRWQGVTNQSSDRLFTLGAGTGAGALWASGQVFGDFAPALSFTNSGAIAFLTANANQTLTLRGTTVSENTFAPLISNNGTGITSLTKTDAGMWVLNNANTYSGTTTISGGTLAISNAGALGTGAISLAGGAGTGLQLRGGLTMNQILTNTVSDGTLVAATGANTWASGLVFGGSNANFRLGVDEGASLNITGIISGSVGTSRFIKFDRGTLTLSGSNTYGGITNVAGGSIVLNYDTTAGGTNTSKLADGAALELGFSGAGAGITTGLGADSDVGGQTYQPAFAGGTVVLSGGSHTEIVSATTLNNGANRVIRNGGSSVLQMGTITRAVANGVNEYGTIDFSAAGIATTNTVNTSGGILANTSTNTASGAYATIDRTNWAVSAASGSNIVINALSSYTANSFAANANTDITSASVNAAANAVTHTVRFNTNNGGITTLNLAGILSLEAGGILVTKNVTDDIVIAGAAGILRRSANTANLDTIIHHHGSGVLSINAVIANNTNAQALTKTGAGLLLLNAANTYTGRLNIQEGVVQIGDGTAATSTARLGNGNNPISMADGTTLRLNVANSNLEFAAGALNGGGLLHLAATNQSIFTLSGDSGNWVGDILVQGGTLRIRGNNNALGNLRSITTIEAGGRLDINGSTQSFAERIVLKEGALFTVTNNGATNSNATISGVMTLQNTTTAGVNFNVGTTQALTITAPIRTTNGFTKSGNGILTLSANQMVGFLEGTAAGATTPNANPVLMGQIIVAAGELRVGNVRALGATGVGNETIVQSGATIDLRGNSLNYADDPTTSREIIRVSGSGVNNVGALKNTSGLGVVSSVVFEGNTTLSGGGFVNGSRLVVAPFDINPNLGSNLPGNLTRMEAVIDGNNANLTIVGSATANDANGVGVTFRDPKFTSPLSSIDIRESTFRIEEEAGSDATFSGLTTANITNGITIGYGGATLADHTNSSLGVGPNIGARLNFYRSWNTSHSVNITMDGVRAKDNLGVNYIDVGNDATIPNPRTYLTGQITLLGDSNRNVFHIDGSAIQQTLGEQGNQTGTIQSKLVVNGQIVGSGGFTKTGARELRLTGNNTFTGSVNVLRFITAAVAWQDNLTNINGVDYQTLGDAEAWAEWGLTLSGADGRLSGTDSINLQRRGLITLDNTNRLDASSGAGVVGGNNNDRINNSASINFDHGWLKIIGGTTNNSEALATTGGARINVNSGTNILDIMPTDGANTAISLTIGEISRSAGAILQFNNLDSTSKFGTTSTPESVRITLNNIGGLTQVGNGVGTTDKNVIIGLLGGIMPHEYLSDIRLLGFNNAGASDYLNQGRNQQFITASHFMTYDAATKILRPLDDSEYYVPANGLIDNVAGGAAGKNVNLSDAFTIVRDNTAINALRFGALADNNGDGSAPTINDRTTLTSYVDGNPIQMYVDGTLTINSGMISSASFTTGNSSNLATIIAGGTLNFGNREAIINNQNAMIRTSDGLVATANFEIRSTIAGTGGLLKTGIAQVVLDGRNTYSGVTTISNGTLFLRSGRQGLGAGGEGNGVVIVGNGSLNSGGGLQVGTPTAYENILVKALQANQYVMRVDNDLTNWYTNLVVDNVDAAGQVIFTPLVRTDNSATAIINGNIYGGATSVTNDILAIDSRLIQFEMGGSNTFLFRGQFGDRGDVNGNAVPIADRISSLPTVAGVRTNENEVLRVQLAGTTEGNFVYDKQYNAAGRLTVIQGNMIVNYDPNDPSRDGNGFWTDTAISKIPNADSTTTSFAINGTTSQQGFILGNANNSQSSLLMTKPGQIFNMASWSTAGSGIKWIGGTNESGEVRFGSSTATGTLSIGGTAVRLYANAGGTVVFDQRMAGNPGTFPDNLGFMKVGRGTVVLQSSTNATASDASFEIAGGKLVLDHSGQNVARVGGNNARLSGGVVHALANLTANSTVGYAITNGANSVLQLREGTTELIAEGRSTRSMTVNLGNANANNNRSNLTRNTGSAVNFVEAITGNGNGIISLNFNNFTNVAVKNRIISWATYGNTAREALDFAMADAGAANRVKAINRVAGEYLNDVSAWNTGMDVSENGGAGFFGSLTGSKILNTVRFDTMADSLVTIGSGQTLTLSGDGVAGGILVSSNTGSANKTINGGSIAAFSTSYTGGTTVNSNVITNVSSTANLVVGMPVTGNGIPAGAFITAINGNSITISANATVTSASVPIVTSTPEIIVHQYGKGTLTIGSTITGNSSLTIAGPATTSPDQFGTTGVVKLTGNNTYTGRTFVTGAVLEISDTLALGPNPTSFANSQLTLNGGTLRWTGGTGSLDNRGVALHGGGGVIDVVNSTGNLVIGNALNSAQSSLISQEIFRGDLIKMGAGSLTLLGNNGTFQGLMDVRQGSLIVMSDSGNANTGTTTVLGSNRSWADGTILRSGTNIQLFLGNGNNGGDWTMDEFFTFEGGNTFTYGGLMDTSIAATLNGQQFNLGNRRPLNLNGILDIKGTTTFDVVPNAVMRLNNGSGYLTGSGDIVKDGQGRMEFRSNVPDWTGNLVIKQGLVYAANQADVLGSGYASGKTITLGSDDRQGTAELLILSPDTNNQGFEFDINHDINVVYNPAQTKRLGIDGIANGNKVSYNGDITLNDSLILLIRDINVAVGGEQSYVNFNGSFRDGTTTSGNLVVQTDDADGANSSPTNGRGVGYAVLNGDNSAWTGDITIGTNQVYNQDTTAVLRLGNVKALTAANDVTMNFNSILQAGGQNVTIGSLTTQGGNGAFYGEAGTMSSTNVGSSEIIENAASTAATLTITQSTPVAYEASWDAFFRDGTLNSQFFAPGANTQQRSAALSLTKAGNGWATLSLDNDYSGSTVVQGGILQVGRNGIGDTGTSPSAANALTLKTTVMSGATIAGSGIVQGGLTLELGANLSPGDNGGNAIGTLTVSGDAMFKDGSNALFQLRNASYNNPNALTVSDENYGFWKNTVTSDEFSNALDNLVTTSQHDMLISTGEVNLTAGMTITIQNDGYTPKAGDIFRLIKGSSYAGGINVGADTRKGGETGLDLILFALGGNLLWDVSLFNDQGILMVVEADVNIASITPPDIENEPSSTHNQAEVLDPGTSVTLSALATSDGDPTKLKYQWRRNGSTVQFTSSPTYTFTASFSTQGVYSLIVSNEGGSTPATTTITVLVKTVPLIDNIPPVNAVAPGGSRSFTAVVDGEATKPDGSPGYLYQWFKDDIAIEGATNVNLSLTNITEADEGNYSIEVTNIAGTTRSNEVFVDVVDPVTNVIATVNPTDTYTGQTITFSSSFAGEGSITYQWRRNETPISGATAATYTLPNVQAISAGDYSVVVTSRVDGTVASIGTSNTISLNLKNPLPQINSLPLSQTVLAGQPIDLKVTAQGLPMLRYTWKRNNVVVASSTTASVLISPLDTNTTVAQGGTYIVEVANSAGKVSTTATPAEVVVVDSSTLDLPVAVGAAATFTARVGAGPKTPLTYKWMRFATRPVVIGPGPDEIEGTEDDEMGTEEYEVPIDASRVTGLTGRILKITKTSLDGVAGDDNGIYRCEIKGPVGDPVIGSGYDLRVFNAAPQFTDAFTFPDGLIGRDYEFTVPFNTADRARSPDKITAAGLPPGLKIDPITGKITGKPTATKVGGYKVTITLANKFGKVTSAPGTLIINDLTQTIPGAWVGIVDRNPNLGGNLGGRVDLTVTTKSTFTGKLILGATTYSFTGPLNVNGPAPTGTVFIKRTGNPLPDPLRLDFELDPGNNTITSGSVSDGYTTVNFDGWRQSFSKTLPASTYTGYYTMAVGLSDDSPLIVDGGTPNVPQGAGYAAFTVAADGKLSMAGKLADGEAFTNATFVGPNGELAVFQYLYKAVKPGGSILGQFAIDDKDDADLLNSNNTVSGSATWVRPAGKLTDRTFRAGFGIVGAPISAPVVVVASGGRYDAPAAGTLVLGIPEPLVPEYNTTVDFFNGGDLDFAYNVDGTDFLSQNPDRDFALIKGGKFTIFKQDVPANITKTAVSAVAKTGLVSGSFSTRDYNPAAPSKPDFVVRSVKFQGIIIHEEGQLIGVGYFLLPQLPNPAAGTSDKTSPIYSGRFILEELP